MKCGIRFTDGSPKLEFDSIVDAVIWAQKEYDDHVIVDVSGNERDSDDPDSSYTPIHGRIAWIWDSREASVNDDGSKAVAVIYPA